jgi:EAL domain-containing protein (putative c-di-GMP-specific phosphodiesterase class I)
VAVNLSASSLADREFVGALEEELELTGADPRRLVFEVTETALAENLGAAADLARRLTELGCRLSLDDFGTGYGSFTYARHLPVSFLKIDAEFVRGIASDRASQHVVQAVVNLAQAFGSQTIAEGVEEESAVPLLAELGVDYMQGYLFGKPKLVERDLVAQPQARLA